MQSYRVGFPTTLIEIAVYHRQKGRIAEIESQKKKNSFKILPLDNLILAELTADEKVSEEEVAEEIERSRRLKADATQRLAAIEERLNEQSNESKSRPEF